MALNMYDHVERLMLCFGLQSTVYIMSLYIESHLLQ
jgi:hypothetical protein